MNRVTRLLPQHFRRAINRIWRRIKAIEQRITNIEES